MPTASNNNTFNLIRRLLAFVFVSVIAASCQPRSDTVSRPLNGEALHIVWSRDVGAPINHPPLWIGNILVVAPIRMPLLGLDAATGKTIWSFDPGVRIWDRAYGSDGKRLFIGLEGGRYAALDPSNGRVLWETSLGINSQMPPFVADGVAYVPTTFTGPGIPGDPNGKAAIFALDVEDGHVIWSFESGNYILQTPFKRDGTVYLAGSFSAPEIIDEGGHMRMYALDAGDGSVKWVYESDDGFTKQVYAASDVVSYIAYQDFIVGVDARSGELLWRRDTGNWVPTLMGSDETIYYGSANTTVHAIQAGSGETLWTYNIPEGSFNYLIGAPVLVAGELVFLTQLGEIVSLDAATGELRWQINAGVASARTGLSVSGGWLFAGDGQGTVYGFSD
jgi:outer membrane protein assembly factor BamB